MKLSKAAKARIKRMNMKERKDVMKAAMLLCDNEMITPQRYETIHRTLSRSSSLC